jgi:hypothetical protein
MSLCNDPWCTITLLNSINLDFASLLLHPWLWVSRSLWPSPVHSVPRSSSCLYPWLGQLSPSYAHRVSLKQCPSYFWCPLSIDIPIFEPSHLFNCVEPCKLCIKHYSTLSTFVSPLIGLSSKPPKLIRELSLTHDSLKLLQTQWKNIEKKCMVTQIAFTLCYLIEDLML